MFLEAKMYRIQMLVTLLSHTPSTNKQLCTQIRFRCYFLFHLEMELLFPSHKLGNLPTETVAHLIDFILHIF